MLFQEMRLCSSETEIIRVVNSVGASRLLLGPFQEPVQARAANPQKLRRANSIAFTSVQNAPDVLPPDFLQRERSPGVLQIDAGDPPAFAGFREVIHVDKLLD